MQGKYYVKYVAVDSYRYGLLREYLETIGVGREYDNLILVRPSDIMKMYPIINRCFTNGYFSWGDNPCLRWACNNVKLVRAKKSTLAMSGDADVGNYLFGKIEPHTRKTDPFMALVASMCGEDRLINQLSPNASHKRIRIQTY